MMFSFESKIASRGYHVYRNSTWQNAKPGQKIKVERETNVSSKSIDPYACAIKEGGSISGHLLSTNYKVSPIPAGGLEVPLLLTFSVKHERVHKLMKEFIGTLYDYNYNGERTYDTNNEEESDEEEVVEIKLKGDEEEQQGEGEDQGDGEQGEGEDQGAGEQGDEEDQGEVEEQVDGKNQAQEKIIIIEID